MPRNGSGSYNPPLSSWNPAIANQTISSDDWNALREDMSTAISQSVASDGQTTASNKIPFAQGLSVSNGTELVPSISFIADPDTGFYRTAANEGGFSSNGAALYTWTASGVSFLQGFSVPALTIPNAQLARGVGRFAGGRLVLSGNAVTGGLNIASGTWSGAGPYEVAVVFTTAANSANYQVIATPENGGSTPSGTADNITVLSTGKTVNGFTLQFNSSVAAMHISVFEG